VPYIVIIPAGADSFHQEGSDFFNDRKFMDGGCHLCRDVTEARSSPDRFIGEERREDCEERKAKSKRRRRERER
jgi:hypothetical protein